MPKGTIDRTQLHRHELKRLPALNGEAAGYVVLRQFTYHEMMHLRDLASKIGWEEKRARKGSKQEDIIKAQLEAMNVAVMEYEFKNSIVEHNIEDGEGKLLDFGNPNSYRDLDPNIGAEIRGLIDDLNEALDEDEVEDFPIASKPSFGEETTPTDTLEESLSSNV